LGTIDITPVSVKTAASRRLLATFVSELSQCGRDPQETEAQRRRIRAAFFAKAEKLKATDALALVASGRVVADLVDQGWVLTLNGKERLLALRPSTPVYAVRTDKRRRYQITRDAQLRQPSTRAFIQRMERGLLNSAGRHSIYSLMRDGRQLHSDIEVALSGASGKKLEDLVRPYLQFIRPNDVCSETGLSLQDIWRYFRHTWSNPYESVPGRSMLFLVRDGAAPNHAVMGIGAISSAAVQLDARDRFIGWLGEDFIRHFQEQGRTEYMDWAVSTIDRAIQAIYRQDFLELGILPARLPKVTPCVIISKLRQLAAKSRDEHYLRAGSSLNKASGNASKVTAAEWKRYARSPLFTHKRAREIASLLEIRNTLQAAERLPDDKRIEQLLASSDGRAALQKVVRLARSMTVGTEIADLTVCGAVPPYNVLLGGKLVAMLAASPAVVSEYRRRYEALPSVIASSMAGKAVIRSANLAFIGTTSLYGERPNQYDRTSYPCDIVGGAKGTSIRYRYLTSPDQSRTSGVGTFQFGRETKIAIERYLSSNTSGRRVNNVFGEGTSPKLRSLRDGLNALGFDSDQMLEHGMKKVVYGVPLISNIARYLLRLDFEPRYLFSLNEPDAKTASIVRYWLERWALPRMENAETRRNLTAHTLVRPIQHGARVPLPLEDVDQLAFGD